MVDENLIKFPSVVSGWRSIETAPKDRFVLLYCPADNTRWLAKWQHDLWYGVDVESGFPRCSMGPKDITGWNVTHWQEVPAAPRHAPLPERE